MRSIVLFLRALLFLALATSLAAGTPIPTKGPTMEKVPATENIPTTGQLIAKEKKYLLGGRWSQTRKVSRFLSIFVLIYTHVLRRT